MVISHHNKDRELLHLPKENGSSGEEGLPATGMARVLQWSFRKQFTVFSIRVWTLDLCSCLNLKLFHTFHYMVVKPGVEALSIIDAKGKVITRRGLNSLLTFETSRAPDVSSNKRKLGRRCSFPGTASGSSLRMLVQIIQVSGDIFIFLLK